MFTDILRLIAELRPPPITFAGIVTLAKNRRFPSRFGLATSVLRH
jgi:hypothetical protein